MSLVNWRFPPLSGGNEQGYTNSGIETFKGEELIDNLAREICQNSLDAKDKESDFPVEVNFELRNIVRADYNVFSDYSACIEGCKKYWQQEMDGKLKNFISRAESTLSNDVIPILVIRDYNTTGLTGSKAQKKDLWTRLTHSDGTSLKSDAGSGGSYGIGKNAPFACSDLSMVFYNTYAKDGVKAFKGVSRLATILDKNDEPTQGVGHYQINNETEKEWRPIFGEDTSLFRDLFGRNEYGTDIIVVGFNEVDKWSIKIEKAIINHFFPAVYEGNLVVRVGENVIDSDTITDKIKIKFADDKNVKITGQLFEAMINPDKKEMLNILEENDAELFIKSDSGYSRTIFNFRSTGMLVGKYTRRILQHYAAVLIIRGQALNELLKDTEPPKHNKWDHKLIEKHEKEKRKRARECIGKIENEVINLLKEQYETVNENEIDSDTGEFIPDDNADVGIDVVGDDVLKIKQQLGAVRKKEIKSSESKENAIKDKGEDKGEANVNNEEKSPNPDPIPPKPRVEYKDDEDTAGISPGHGSKIISAVNILKQKIYPLDFENGIYKAIIMPQEDYKNVNISFSVMGEDGSSDKLRIAYYMISDVKKRAVDGEIKSEELKKGIVNDIIVCFESREKMVLKMSIEGGRATI